ncbi:MAG: hypothetical protein ACK4GM_16920, partial [Tabrizicola sp.]
MARMTVASEGLGDETGGGARLAGAQPFEACHLLVAALHGRADGAMAGAQVVAEPGDDERDALEIRAERLRLVEGDGEVGAVACRVARLGGRAAEAVLAGMDAGLVAEFGGAGDDDERPHHGLQHANR